MCGKSTVPAAFCEWLLADCYEMASRRLADEQLAADALLLDEAEYDVFQGHLTRGVRAPSRGRRLKVAPVVQVIAQLLPPLDGGDDIPGPDIHYLPGAFGGIPQPGLPGQEHDGILLAKLAKSSHPVLVAAPYRSRQ